MKKKIVSIFFAIAVLLAPVMVSGTSFALFDNAKSEACAGLAVSDTGKCGDGGSTINLVLKNVLNVLTVIIGLIAVIMIIVGGTKYITSGGDSGKAGSARSTIISAVVGLVIVALAQIIVQFVLKNATPSAPEKKAMITIHDSYIALDA